MKEAIDSLPMLAKVPIVVVPSIVAMYLVWFVTLGVGANAASAAETSKANGAKIDGVSKQVNETMAAQTRVLRALCAAIAKGDNVILQQCLGA